MTRYLHTLSAVLFYVLGAIFFLAYILEFNTIAVTPSMQWMEIADLPLVCVALLYGGTSVYLSLTQNREPSKGLAWTLILPLAILFVATATLKFWPTPFILNP
jgi:hypothetical protein